jgi:hypothetical protein
MSPMWTLEPGRIYVLHLTSKGFGRFTLSYVTLPSVVLSCVGYFCILDKKAATHFLAHS